MGRWGAGIFESDDDYNYVGEIQHAARCLLLHPRRSREVLADRLNNGLSEKLMKRFASSPPHVVFVVALLMKNGANISDETKACFNEAICKTPLTETTYNQLLEACANYTPGKPWDFQEHSLFDALADKCQDENLIASVQTAISVINSSLLVD